MTPHPTRRIRIRLALVSDRRSRAWLTLQVRARDDGDVRAALDVPTALTGQEPTTPAQQTILKTEIMGGVVTAKRHARRGCSVELMALGGETPEGGITQVPSIAYAVAANLAVLQGLEVEDLRQQPRGGYGWALEEVGVDTVD